MAEALIIAEALIRQRVEDLAKALRAKDIDGVISLYAPRGLYVTIGTRTHRARRRAGSGWRGELLPQSSLLSGASRACDGRFSIAWRGRRSSKTIATFRWKFGHCVKSSDRKSVV